MRPYCPLNVLKPFDRDLWIVDGPIVEMRYLAMGQMPFPTRMTILRLPGGRLWVHSPTELTAGLKEELAVLGPVAWLIAPNRLHWTFLSAWQQAYPEARTFAAPGVEKRAGEGGFRIDEMLGEAPPDAWAGVLHQLLLRGSFFWAEAVFFHRPTATLILTDLIENFEPGHIESRPLAFLMRLGGVLDPEGSTPRDMRLTFLGRRAALRRAVETMLAWEPKRVILAHGRCFEQNANEELRRAFAWVGVG